MWYKAGKFILQQRLFLLILLFGATAFMGWKASKVQLSYDFTRALPTDNPKYREYQAFLKKFGGDGNTMVVGIETDQLFTVTLFNQLGQLHQQLKKVPGVTDILSIPEVVNLKNDSINHKLVPERIFHYPYTSQPALDSDRIVFENLPFYRHLLYNFPISQFQNSKIFPGYLMGVSVNKDTINSKSRTRLINDIMQEVEGFSKQTNLPVFVSGLPFIRTTIGNRIKAEIICFCWAHCYYP